MGFRCRLVSLFSLAMVGAAFGNALAADRATADALLAGVPELLRNNDYTSVEEFCIRSLQADHTCPNAHYYLGLCFEKNTKIREAVREFQAAATAATEEKDVPLAAKAAAAAKRLGAGLSEVDALDANFAAKLDRLASEACDAGRLETARKTYALLAALQPDNHKAKEGLEKTSKAIEERGDPVKSRIGAAMLSEIWFKIGTGKKDEAKALAQALAAKYPDTEMGKEALGLVEREFAAPKRDEVSLLTEKLKTEGEKKSVVARAVPSSASPSATASAALDCRIDVDTAQKAADEQVKKLAKETLVPEFAACLKRGKELHSKAMPGSDGNQANLARALEQFIKADSLYARIEGENLSTGELAAQSQESRMLHYACLKMTLLSR